MWCEDTTTSLKYQCDSVTGFKTRPAAWSAPTSDTELDSWHKILELFGLLFLEPSGSSQARCPSVGCVSSRHGLGKLYFVSSGLKCFDLLTKHVAAAAHWELFMVTGHVFKVCITRQGM